MQVVLRDNTYNPNPITKLLSTLFLGFTVVHTLNPIASWGVILFFSIMFFINGERKDALKNIIWFSILFQVPNFEFLYSMPIIIKIILSLFFVIRMFYLPYISGKFLIKTSDVGSIITSLDKIKVPLALSIPIAVMFRFFPSFQESRNNIYLAMKIRGITAKNPIKYIEYVMVPLLILSSNTADDIAKAAETKCIENPIAKTRYTRVRAGIIDFIYLLITAGLLAGGWLW